MYFSTIKYYKLSRHVTVKGWFQSFFKILLKAKTPRKMVLLEWIVKRKKPSTRLDLPTINIY